MAIANLQSIIMKTRKFTGQGNNSQMTDAQIIDYINSFYLYSFPAAFRSLKLKDTYTFNTYRGIDVYPFDFEHFTTVEMPCYCLDRQITLSHNPGNFYGISTNWQQQQVLATGDGTIGPYSGTITVAPLIRSVNNNPKVSDTLSSTALWPTGRPLTFNQAIPGRVQNLLISADIAYGDTVHVTDDGDGNLIGDCTTGVVNYETGVVSNLRFTYQGAPQVIPSGYDINVQSKPANMNFPLYIMFYQNQFTLRPVPDKGYTVTLTAYRQPSQALLGTLDPEAYEPGTPGGTPELLEWWECLAAGAAKKIYQERLDSDGMQLMENILQDAYAAIEARTYAQLGSQSIRTIYSGQLEGYGNGNVIFNNNAGY